jgi:hypothetical protein
MTDPMDIIFEEAELYFNEANQEKVDKEKLRINKLLKKKLTKHDKLTVEIRKASKMEVIAMTGLLGNHIAEKEYGGAYTMTIYNSDNKKLGSYLTCNFSTSDLDSDIKSKVKVINA